MHGEICMHGEIACMHLMRRAALDLALDKGADAAQQLDPLLGGHASVAGTQCDGMRGETDERDEGDERGRETRETREMRERD